MSFCPVCSEVVEEKDYKEIYISPYNSQEYKRYECPSCDLHWWEPLRVDVGFYENEQLLFYCSLHSGTSHLSPHHRPFFEHYPMIKGKVLDIGCGNGAFIKELKNLGFEVWGIDFDRKSVDVAKNKFGLKNVFCMSLDDFCEYAKDESLKFDLITFFEVLEHQDDPKNFLKKATSLLTSGGYIAGSVPNRNRFLASLDRKVFKVDFPPHHFFYFDRCSLRNLFDMFGFEDILFVPVTKNIFEFSAYLESILLGELSLKLKRKLKKKVINEDRLSVEDYEKLYGRSWKTFVLNTFRIARTLFFLPLTLILIYPFNKRGYQIYFQAKYKLNL